MDINMQSAHFVAPGGGTKLWVMSELITFIVGTEETGGRYALTDSLVPPRGEVPPHFHEREDEAFWVLEGELEILVGEERFRAGPGAFAHLPRGVPHAYRNVGEGIARFLTLMVPAGLERFFKEVGTPAAHNSMPPPGDEADLAKVIEIASRYGVTIEDV